MRPAVVCAFAICSSCGQEPRRLEPQRLVPATSIDFQDLDLESGKIGGPIVWDPPEDTTDVTAYEVYLADSTGGVAGPGDPLPDLRLHLGTVAVGTQSLSLPLSTVLNGSLSHIFVHTRSLLGISPEGTGVAVCDVASQDSLYIVNAATQTAAWGVTELKFYTQPDCSGDPMRYVQTGSTGAAGAYPDGHAFDANEATAWVSSCTDCAAGHVSLGVIGVCEPAEVRCVSVRQCLPSGATTGCPSGLERLQQITLLARGEVVYTWKTLRGAQSGQGFQGYLEEEKLMVAGRRRRAAFTVLSDTVIASRSDQFTNPGFSR